MSTRSSGNPVISARQTTATKSGVGRLRIVARASAPRPRPLEAVSTYRINDRIADSDRATLFTAEHKVTGQVVTAKFFNLAGPLAAVVGTDDEQTWRRQFALETRIMEIVHHPNVVPLLGHGNIPGGRPCLIMPFVESDLQCELGRNVSDERLLAHLNPEHKPKRMRPERAFQVLRQILGGLGALHDLGVIHRGISPGNVLMTRRHGGEARLCGFGVAKWGDSLFEVDASLIGTEGYASPEQEANPADVDATTDIYAMGAMAYRMLTGRVPGKGKTSILEAGATVSTNVDYVVQTCLAQNPDERPADAQALQATLDWAIAG